MAKYKKRADGRYSTSVTIGRQANGKRKIKVLYARTIQELDNKVAEFRAQLNKGLVIAQTKMTVSEWAWEWLKLYKQNISEQRKAALRGVIAGHLIPAFGNTRLVALKKEQVQTLINQIVADGHIPQARAVLSTLRQMIKKAIANDYVVKDVTAEIEVPSQKSQRRALTKSEADAALSCDLPPMERLFVDLLYYTGIRRGEALALEKNDIDLTRRTVRINKNVQFYPKKHIKSSPKTVAGNREIPLPDVLCSELYNYTEANTAEHLFTDRTGNIMSQRSYERMWERIAKAFRIECLKKGIEPPEKFTAHMFRHTYATNLYYAGIDVKSAQYLLGHSTIQVTLDIYTHLDKSKILNASDRLNDFFNAS